MSLNRYATTAIALATVLAAAPSHALPPTAPAGITLRIAGSTIQDNNLVSVLQQICKSGSLDQYRDNDAVGKGTYYRAFFCTIDSSKVPGLGVADPNLLILKRNRSGAITGVYPLLEPSKPINMMGISNVVGGVPQCSETSAGSGNWLCSTDRTGDVTKQLPDMGVSDIDPQIFRGVNYSSTLDGSTTFSQPTATAVAANLTVKNAGAVVQNTPVTLELRNALQKAQIQTGALPAGCAIGDESEACMPSLSKALLTSLFAGRIAKWSDIKVESAGTAAPLTDFATSAPDDDKVYLCRRNKGASTQAAINAYFLNTPCAATGTPPVEVSNPLLGPVVVAPSQVTAEETCLDDFNNGTNAGTLNGANAKVWAIGMLTTERNTALTKGYRYIKIDGFAPTVEEVAAGHYTYFSEAAYLWRKVDPKPSADALALIEKLAADATAPAVFGQLNAGIVHPWGKGSFVAVSSQGHPVTHPFNAAQPVTPYTHAPTGTTVDNCRLPQVDDGVNGKTPIL